MSEEVDSSSWWDLGSNLTSNFTAGIGSLSNNVTSNLSAGIGSLSNNVTSNLSAGIGSLSDNVSNNLSDGFGSLSNVTGDLSSGVGSISNMAGVGSLSDVTSNLSSGVGSLWSKAKETGSYVYEFTASDLNEVATALKQDVIVPGAAALKHKLQPHAQYGSLTDSVATMLGNVSEYLTVPHQVSVEMLSRYGQDRIQAIQTSHDTYLKHETDEHYTEWSGSFTLEERTHEISQLLVDNQKLRDLHTALVPTQMSYTSFWRIFYYRTDLFNLEKQRHEALLSRADKEETEDELKWSDDEEEAPTEESSVVTEQPVPGLKEDKDVKFDEVSQPADVAIDQGSMSESGVVTEDQSKVDVSSEEGSYDVIKHKDLDEGSAAKDTDDDFEKELDDMIEDIGTPKTTKPVVDEDDHEWEDWD